MPEETSTERIASLQTVVEKDPATALYLPLAEWLRDQGRVEEAIRLCEERKNRPGHGVGDQIVLGRCYLADGRLPEARSAFEAALGLDRENVAALKALAGILAHEGGHARAIDLYRAVCRVDPGDLESQTALHQITSGEYADVCPADVVVGESDAGWQPVRLPREEDHIPDLALGLRTIETFDPSLPGESAPPERSFRELSMDELERAADASLEREETPIAAPFEGDFTTRVIDLPDPSGVSSPSWAARPPAPEPPAPSSPWAARAPTPEPVAPSSPWAASPPAPEPPAPSLPWTTHPPAPEPVAPSRSWTSRPPAPRPPVAPEPLTGASKMNGEAAAPDVAPETPAPPRPSGNRSAFEEWLHRLGGGS